MNKWEFVIRQANGAEVGLKGFNRLFFLSRSIGKDEGLMCIIVVLGRAIEVYRPLS